MNDEVAGRTSGGAAPVAKPIRNLLIVHTPLYQDISDWLEVKRRIEERAPDIEVRIAANGMPNSVTRRWQVSRPSLIFSACPLLEYKPKGGADYSTRHIAKTEQMERLARHGLPAPMATMLTQDLALDPTQWGPYVIAKPPYGGRAQHVRLVRIRDLAARYPELTLNGQRSMMVQPYIEHSENGHPTSCRVLTLFGHALFSARSRWAVPKAPIEEIATDPNGIIASNDRTFGRVWSLCDDMDIIALGERAHTAFPECPLLGVDIIRETATGKLYVVEVNPEGFTWHFSSQVAKTEFTPDYRRGLYAQFDALDRTAQLLIEKTRMEAT